ncbi:peptidase, partial [Bifidobacteriaceae bacterium NR016]
EIKNDLDAAKRQNAINEQNAKNAGIAKLEAKKAELDAAYNALTDEQKAKAKDKYEAATKAIDDAKNTVNSATKPSEIKDAVDGVKTSFDDANKAIEDAKGKRDISQNTYDDQSVLNKEKEDQKKRIQDSDLPDAEKQKAIDDINDAKKIGDPTAIANRALKAKKIEDAKKQIAALDHLNNAQKEAFKKIIEDTDASDHKNADGTTSDDIDDALA